MTPAVRRLLENDWMTAEYIRYHTQRLRDEKRLSPALLITVLRTHDPAPGLQRQRRRRSPYRLPRSAFRRVPRPTSPAETPAGSPAGTPDEGQAAPFAAGAEAAAPLAPLEDPRLDQPCPECLGKTPRQVWEIAASIVEPELRLVARQRQFRDCLLWAYDPQSGPGFTILAPDQTACEWFAGRLPALLRRALTAYCGVDVQVSFLAPQDLQTSAGASSPTA